MGLSHNQGASEGGIVLASSKDLPREKPSSVRSFVNWARKYSLFQYPFVTACCGMEFMSGMGPHWDLARFGAEFPRFSPRQSDLLWVVGTISHKQAPVLKRVFDQMCAPKWVIAYGTCASCGGFYDNYATVQGIDEIIPVDVFIPGCPPRPEAFQDGIILLMDLIQSETRTSWEAAGAEKGALK